MLSKKPWLPRLQCRELPFVQTVLLVDQLLLRGHLACHLPWLRVTRRSSEELVIALPAPHALHWPHFVLYLGLVVGGQVEVRRLESYGVLTGHVVDGAERIGAVVEERVD